MMKKRRRTIKQRRQPTEEDLRQRKYKEVKKLSKKANQRLKSLERRYKSGTWASKKLKNRLYR